MWEKQFPFLMRKTTYSEQYHENAAGQGFSFDDETIPGGWRDLTTYMNEEWELGTASLPYVNAGHADCVMVRIRRSAEIRSSEDFRSLYTRGVFNGACVGQRNRCHVTGGDIDASYLSKNPVVPSQPDRAIVFAAPKRAGHRGIRSFRLDLIAGWAAPFDQLYVDDLPVDRLPVEADARSRICFRDSNTYGLILPLALSPAAEPHPLRLWTVNGHMMLSLYNYNGSSLDVERDALTAWRNGFILHLSLAQQWNSFEEFRAWSKAGRVTESFAENRVREVVYECADGMMRALYDPWREVFLTAERPGQARSCRYFCSLSASMAAPTPGTSRTRMAPSWILSGSASRSSVMSR
jgi:hypothetical protein